MNASKQSPSLLAIDTATSACSVALHHDGRDYHRFDVGQNIHSQVLLDRIAEVVAEANTSIGKLSAVAVGQGPGSFTGLRIGIGVAQGLAYGIGCPMIGVSSLAALAQQGLHLLPKNEHGKRILAGIDARMNEIYLAEFVQQGDFVFQSQTAQVLPPDRIATEHDNVVLVGNAWQVYRSQLEPALLAQAFELDDVIYPQARFILALARQKYERQEWINPLTFTPEYVRNNVAKTLAERAR